MIPAGPETRLDYRVYERISAAVLADNLGSVDVTVTPNAKIMGISRTQRQVDVLLDARWEDDHSRRIIADAKLHRRKIDIKHVEEFEGMMADCRAGRGVIVCPEGWTDAAMRRAKEAISIRLLSREEALNFEWGAMEPCIGQCNHRGLSGLVLWDSQLPLQVDGLLSVTWSGKCDQCHNFHAWCWDCGERFALADEDEHRCECGRVWTTLIEAEIDGPYADEDVAVHLFLSVGPSVLPVDRRMLR